MTTQTRINWIDWAKATAAMTVVFCHLPQSQEWFYFRYLQASIITVFFFLSGYLKKDRDDSGDRWHKYWRGLILPYIIYNVLVYPYWLTKYCMLHEGMPSVWELVSPLLITCIGEPIDGPLWYLPAILLMHLLTDALHRSRWFHPMMIGLCVLTFFLYAANKYWSYAPWLLPMGVMRRLPYYYIGYVMGRRLLFREVRFRREIIVCVGCLAASLLLFWWHLNEQCFLLHIALFYVVNISFLFAALCGCKLLDHCKSRVVVRLSMGTLVVIGLHDVPITCINFLIGKALHIGMPCYEWYVALPLAILIVAMLYPIIVFAERRLPALLGR